MFIGSFLEALEFHVRPVGPLLEFLGRLRSRVSRALFIVKSVIPSSIRRIFDYAQSHLVDLQKAPNSCLNFDDMGMFKT